MVNEEAVMENNYFGKSVGAQVGIGELHSSSLKVLPYFFPHALWLFNVM